MYIHCQNLTKMKMDNCINILLWILGSVWITVLAYEDCRGNTTRANGLNCCSECQPGYGLVNNCTNDTDTQCNKCIMGKTFSPSSQHREPCTACKKCKKFEHVESPCNVTHDSVCECNIDFYYSKDKNGCQLCTFCPVGSGVTRKCLGMENSVCVKCQNGTYSDVVSAMASCKPCTKCTDRQITLVNCTTEQNTVCLDIPTPYTTISDDSLAHRKKTPTKKEKGFDVIPVYCAILGSVVVGLLGYVLFKHYSRMKDKKRHKVHDPHEDVEYSKASGGDSGVFVEADMQLKSYNQLTKVKDLPLTKRKSMEHSLSTKRHNADDWKALAQELGYTCRKIDSIEDNSSGHVHCVQNLLTDWSKKKHSTVGVLIKALINIGRTDVVKILQTDLQISKSENKSVLIV